MIKDMNCQKMLNLEFTEAVTTHHVRGIYSAGESQINFYERLFYKNI